MLTRALARCRASTLRCRIVLAVALPLLRLRRSSSFEKRASMRKTALAILALALALPFPAAAEDTPELRLQHAKRYLEATNSRKMIDDLAIQMAATLPPEHREEFVALMKDHLDLAALEKVMLDNMVEVFTADELAALADFWGSPVGKSAMDKMPVYMGRAWPQLQAMLVEAMQSAQTAPGP